jgi:hypothetical protein
MTDMQTDLSPTEDGATGLLIPDDQRRNRLAADGTADGESSPRPIGPDGSTRWEVR